MGIPLAALALLLELTLGYPDGLYRRIGHPVSWIGGLVAALDRSLNREARTPAARRAAGALALAVVLAAAVIPAWLLQRTFGGGAGLVIAALAGGTLLAQRSLAAHVAAVAAALEAGGLDAGRAAVARIVGRDPERLDAAGVARAAIESLAENFSDGIVAPAFWMALGGLPGAAAYKAVNTADSMIGHHGRRHGAFGWASARLDDLVNLPASRLSALLIVAAAAILPGASPSGAWAAVRRDAGGHRSPNAGWPEAALAGALGFALAGPRHYGGVLAEDAEMGRGGSRQLGPADIRRALRLYWVADALLIAAMAMAALVMLTA